MSIAFPRMWAPEDSTINFLNHFRVYPKNLSQEKTAELLRQTLVVAETSQLETVAHNVAQEVTLPGDDFNATFKLCFDHLKKEQEAVLHPQMG